MRVPRRLRADKATDEERVRVFNRQRLKEEASMGIYALMRDTGVSRTELAERIGKSKPFITKILDGYHNFTLNTLADVFHALGYAVHFTLSRDCEELRRPHIESETTFFADLIETHVISIPLTFPPIANVVSSSDSESLEANAA